MVLSTLMAFDHPLCLEALTLMDVEPPRLAEIAAAEGVRRITIIGTPQDKNQRTVVGDILLRRETRGRCRDLGVRIEIIEGFFVTPFTTDPALNAYRPALETAAWLEARGINVITSNATKETPDLAPAERRKRLGERFGALCDLAAEYDLGVRVELAARAGVKSVRDGISFLMDVKRDNAKLLVDALHFYRSHGNTTDIRAAGDLIAHAQICDGPAELAADKQIHEAYAERLVPGEGAFPLGDFVRSLPPGIPLGIEVPRQELILAGIAPEARAHHAVSATRQLLAAIQVQH